VPADQPIERRHHYRRHEDELVNWRLDALEHNMTALATRMEEERKAREKSEQRRDDRGRNMLAWVVPLVCTSFFSAATLIVVLVTHH
jgi:hypothetical protein